MSNMGVLAIFELYKMESYSFPLVSGFFGLPLFVKCTHSSVCNCRWFIYIAANVKIPQFAYPLKVDGHWGCSYHQQCYYSFGKHLHTSLLDAY